MKKVMCLGALLVFVLAEALPSAPPTAAPAGPIQLVLPLGRKAYQTNEWIDVSVVRHSPQALAAGQLALTLTGADGSKFGFTFPVAAVAVEGKDARATEHYHLNGRLLRPGNYTLQVAADGAVAQSDIEVHSHIRKSSFRIGDWGSRSTGPDQAFMGEDSLGFNLLYPAYGGIGADGSVQGGLDYMWNCTMGGGHQMDLRMECDWSDPYVLFGGAARVVRRAFADRTSPNCIGVHFYDEPGLTWHKHPVTNEMTPHNIPSQDRAFLSAFGKPPLQYHQLKPENAAQVARWMHWGRWKLSFMDAAWKLASYGVNQVRADYIPATQSVYGWSAYADGYYFNVARCLPVMSGHGGYDDYGGAYFNPSYTFEFGRARDLNKPNWYLPSWYGGMPANRFRLEQYLSFMGNLQGMMKPPDMIVHRPAKGQPTSDGIVESNHLMLKLGPIFTAMPVTRPEAAVLYSMSQNLHAQVKDMKDNYTGNGQRDRMLVAYLAGLANHTPLFPLVEEDILDGTLAAHHKAILLPGTEFLPPKVITALEAYISQGGTVLVTDEAKVKIKGAVKVGAAIDISFFQKLGQLWQEKKMDEIRKINTAANIYATAMPLAKALKPHLDKIGVRPALEADSRSIITSRQALGDVEYLFAVNATPDTERGGMNTIKPAAAKLTIPAKPGAIYDAIHGGPVADFKADGKNLTAEYRFGPGQMRVFARTAQPIGGVQVLTPTIYRDYTLATDPLSVEIAAVVTSDKGRVLSGAIPLQIQVVDPLGVSRYDLYRATNRGLFKIKLPLAINDPAGKWKVVVRELLSGKEDVAGFTTTAPAQCGAVAGATPRAVYFGNDRDNVYRMLRTHKDITIALGKSDYHAAAAERLATILKPWDIRCKIVQAADVKAREISADEALTWCGLQPARARPKLPADLAELLKSGPANFIKKFDKNRDGVLTPEECPPFLAKFFDRFSQGQKKLDKNLIVHLTDRNSVNVAGYELRGAVILLGTPEDNPMIAFLQKERFLPYKPGADFPGRGRGMMAWQRDGIGYGSESVTLIASEAKGLAEAVGTLYEAATGLDPLLQWRLPASNSIATATKSPAKVPELTVLRQISLPDRAAAVKPLPQGVAILSQDGTFSVQTAAGQWQKTVKGGEAWKLEASADGHVIVVGASQHLAGFDGKGKQLYDVPLTAETPAPAITFLAVSPDGSRVVAGADNGKLTLLENGKRTWTIGGVKPGDKMARPNPYLSGAFTSDGKTLVALTQNEAHVIQLSDGTAAKKVPGISGAIAPRPAGANFLVSDGRAALWFSPADGKVVRRANLGVFGIVSLVPAGDNVLAVCENAENDKRQLAIGGVRQLKPAEGNAPAQVAWDHQVPGRIVKKVALQNGNTAVAFWGGLVQVLDGTGAVKSARSMPQDVADLQWTDKGLVVALADGRVLTLAAK